MAIGAVLAVRTYEDMYMIAHGVECKPKCIYPDGSSYYRTYDPSRP